MPSYSPNTPVVEVVPALDTPALDIPIATGSRFAPGDRVGQYRLVEMLGQGGLGVVFRAVDDLSGTAVAVKLLKQESVESVVARQRFAKEARMLASVYHPNVAQFLDVGIVDGHDFLVMEYIPGGSVGDLLAEWGRFDERTALRIIADAARGLAAAHELGIIHRDIKPDNLLFRGAGPDASVVVTDFGLARRVIPSDSVQITQPGMWIGTPRYMAPEQIRGNSADARADVYALGATLYHLLAGRTPFIQVGFAELAVAIASTEPDAIDRLVPELSPATVTLVTRCLRKSPDARPMDAREVLADCERILSGEATDLLDHPRLPVGKSVIEYVHEWELAAPPSRLWPYVSNTERLNRAAQLPAVEYVIRHDPVQGMRRYASARVAGFRMEWEEHPFEWVEGRRMGILREFASGPFRWFVSTVDLLPGPNGGTLLRQTLRAEPRNAIAALAVRLEIGWKAKRSLGAVYRRMDEVLTTSPDPIPVADPFETPARPGSALAQRLRSGIDRLIAGGTPAEVAAALGEFVGSASDQEAGRIRPLVLSRRLKLDDTALIDACLKAVPAGLLELRWDVICPVCRIPAVRRPTLNDVLEHERCEACAADFTPDFAEAVEMVFRRHPEIGPVDSGMYCAGGPAHSPHVAAQVRLDPGERVELDLALSAGRYRLRGPQLAWAAELVVGGGPGVGSADVAIAGSAPAIPVMRAEAQRLTLTNPGDKPLLVRIERTVDRSIALTAGRALALPAFRVLFPDQFLRDRPLAPASMVTFLVVSEVNADARAKKLGDGAAALVRQAMIDVVAQQVIAQSGTPLKMAGDGVVAVFGDPAAAVRAAFALPAALAVDPVAAGILIRAAAHRGLAYLGTFGDRVEYFGPAPRYVDRLAEVARVGHLAMTSATADDPAVLRLLRSRPVRFDSIESVDDEMLVQQVALSPPPPPSHAPTPISPPVPIQPKAG